MDQENYKKCKEFGRVRANVALAKLTTFKIGGPADVVVAVDDRTKLAELLTCLSGEGIDFLILGGGANVLMPDEGFRGVVVQVKNAQLKTHNNVVEADAGVDLSEMVLFTIKNNLTGFEWAAGIPGTLGGAIRGNAGAHYSFTGGEIKDSIAAAIVWRNGEVVELSPADCAFGYRDSVFKHGNDIILGGRFTLQPGNGAESLKMTQKIVEERKGKHASEPSAGSFFKNVPLANWKKDLSLLPERFLNYKKIAAGWLIEQCGLKGFTVGGAMVSKEHGNFIINHNGATQADVLAIVAEVTGRVYDKFEVELEPEVQIIR